MKKRKCPECGGDVELCPYCGKPIAVKPKPMPLIPPDIARPRKSRPPINPTTILMYGVGIGQDIVWRNWYEEHYCSDEQESEEASDAK